MKFIMEYKGVNIFHSANETHPAAKTASIAVYPSPFGTYIKVKRFRYTLQEEGAKEKVIESAKNYIEKQLKL